MTYKERMNQIEAERRAAARDEFSVDTQPKLAMPIKTKCERVQPYVVENESGQLVWEGREMPRWQCELLRLRYFGDFMAHWAKKKFFDYTGYENEEAISADFKSHVPYQFAKKYAAKRKHHKGD